MVDEAVKASISLKSEGISTRVINMSSIKPIDEELIIESAIKTGAIVTVEEHSVIGGLGSAVSEVVAEECPVLVKKLGINDVFGQSGNSKELLESYGLTADNIVEKVKETPLPFIVLAIIIVGFPTVSFAISKASNRWEYRKCYEC